jgi:class 3 adenylate cyclase
MPLQTSFTESRRLELVIAFCEISSFGTHSRGMADEEMFRFLAKYYELVGGIVEAAGGRVVKFMCDSGLLLFSGDRPDEAVQALDQLRSEAVGWLSHRGRGLDHVIKAHWGAAIWGRVGTASDRRFDVFGKAVNDAALLLSSPLTLSLALRGRLSKETLALLVPDA